MSGHRYSVPRILHANQSSSKSIEFCEACGLLRMTAHNRMTKRTTTLYVRYVKADKPDGDWPEQQEFFIEPPCPKPYTGFSTKKKPKERARSSASLYLKVPHAVDRATWAKASGIAGVVHIRNHERTVDRFTVMRPRVLVAVLCGAHDAEPQHKLSWVELVHAIAPGLFSAGDAICVACALRVRRRGRGLVIPDSDLIEQE